MGVQVHVGQPSYRAVVEPSGDLWRQEATGPLIESRAVALGAAGRGHSRLAKRRWQAGATGTPAGPIRRPLAEAAVLPAGR
jgi:hypothetical protein